VQYVCRTAVKRLFLSLRRTTVSSDPSQLRENAPILAEYSAEQRNALLKIEATMATVYFILTAELERFETDNQENC